MPSSKRETMKGKKTKPRHHKVKVDVNFFSLRMSIPKIESGFN